MDAMRCLGPEYLTRLADKVFMLSSRSLRCLSFLEISDNQSVASFLELSGSEFILSCSELIKSAKYFLSQIRDSWNETPDLHFKDLVMVRN